MPEESKDVVPSSKSVETPKQLPSYIPFEQPTESGKSSKYSSKLTRKTESGIGSRKMRPNGFAKNVDGKSLQPVACLKKTDWNKTGIIRLHEEIKAFYDAMQPLPEHKAARAEVVSRITDAVQSLWSASKVEVFGSFRTGLYLPTSDVDLVVFGCWDSKPLHTLTEELISRGICDEERVNVLDKASVPIIKLTDKVTGIKVDISFNMTNGLTSAELIQGFLKEFSSLSYLVLILKQFVYQRDLNEVYRGGIGSYSLILLAVNFLQLQTRAEGRMKNVNYGVQLIEFFELYGLHFNYNRTGICVTDGGKYIRKEGNDNGLMSLYIKDPVNAGNDVARGTYNISQVQTAFSHAYHTLCYEVLQPRSDVSCDKPILSCIIDLEYESERSQESLNELARESSKFLTPKRNSFADPCDKTPNKKRDYSTSKANYDPSKNYSSKKRRSDLSTDSESKAKK